MRLKFKTLAYETNAIESVVDCFDGQPISSIWPKGDVRFAVLHSGYRHRSGVRGDQFGCHDRYLPDRYLHTSDPKLLNNNINKPLRSCRKPVPTPGHYADVSGYSWLHQFQTTDT